MTRLMNLLKNVIATKSVTLTRVILLKVCMHKLMDNFTDYWTVCIRRMNFFKLSIIK